MSFHEIIGAVVWLALTFAAAWLGAQFKPDEWYAQLSKPGWNPPNSIFAPVWTVLYLLMAISAWLVWKQHGLVLSLIPLGLYVLQLILNAGWSFLFFGRHRVREALFEMIVLWVFVLLTLISFWMVLPLAGALLIPYLLWVTFAMALNVALWQANRETVTP